MHTSIDNSHYVTENKEVKEATLEGLQFHNKMLKWIKLFCAMRLIADDCCSVLYGDLYLTPIYHKVLDL